MSIEVYETKEYKPEEFLGKVFVFDVRCCYYSLADDVHTFATRTFKGTSYCEITAHWQIPQDMSPTQFRSKRITIWCKIQKMVKREVCVTVEQPDGKKSSDYTNHYVIEAEILKADIN